jgi:hypothetical protein
MDLALAGPRLTVLFRRPHHAPRIVVALERDATSCVTTPIGDAGAP